MPHFGRSSKERLETCDPRIQEIMNELIKIYDCSIMCGHRPKEDQMAAFNEGRSKVTWPNSKHNSLPSRAVDVVPFPVDWDDLSRFYYMAGLIKGIAHQKGYKIRWGRDWDSDNDFNDQTFNDFPHFEVLD